MSNLLNKFERNSVFTEDEGWMLFSIAAIAEAVGWTLLITGICLSRYVLSHNQIPIQIAGRIHGLLFIAYVLASLGLYPAMHWSRSKALVALLASVVPYGSLLFELWATQAKRNEQYLTYRNCVALAMLSLR